MDGCILCPRRCGAVRGEQEGKGRCGMGLLPRVARIAPHYWEEPPVSGLRGTGAVFFSGCALRCAYCQNGEISHRREGRTYTPAALAEALRCLTETGVHTISFVTPTHFTPAILEALSIYRPPVPIVWNTSGYETLETLGLLDGIADVYLPDLKHFSSAMGDLCAHAPDYFQWASAAIREMCRQTGLPQYNAEGIMVKGTLVRHLILPGLTGESIRHLEWVARELPPGTPVSLMRQYIPMNGVSIPGLDRKITAREYRRVLDAMRALGIPGYTQDKHAADSAFVPAFNREESFL